MWNWPDNWYTKETDQKYMDVAYVVVLWSETGVALTATDSPLVSLNIDARNSSNLSLWNWKPLLSFLSFVIIVNSLFQVMDERLDFSQTWPDKLQEVTTYTYGWSFVVAWLGMWATLLASTFFYLSYVYFWVSEFAKKDLHSDSDNNNSPESGNSEETTIDTDKNNSPESGNSAETTIVTDSIANDSIALDLMESNQLHP